MSRDWNYSGLVHDAKINGGPEKYIEIIKDQSFREGILEGKSQERTEILVAEGAVIGIGLLSYAGYKAYSTIKEKHEREKLKKQKQMAKRAEAELIRETKRENSHSINHDKEE